MRKLEWYLTQQIEAALLSLNFPPIEYQFDRPKLEAHGDISINLAMVLARELKQNPRNIATQLVEALALDPERIEKVEIAGPGFINFFVARPALWQGVHRILDAGESYGRSEQPSKQKALVEFVSANPTGPLTIGHGRQAVLGDTIANLLEWAGYMVTREYYFNNAGRQMRVLGESVKLRYLELLGESTEFPEDYYQGEYIKEIARHLLESEGHTLKDNQDISIFKEAAETEIFQDIKKTLHTLNIHFDEYFNETTLYENGEIEAVIQRFKEKGLAYVQDGALWFKSTDFGLEKDRVIVKSSGEPTYRLPDIAYHRNKIERSYDLIVDIFGADHEATYPDVLAGVKALGYNAETIKVLIHQFVTLYQGSEKVKMSTRKANYVTLDELIEETGADVTRWFFLMRSMQSHLNFDLRLAKTHSEENPVYYNQYAHARICSITRKATEQGIRFHNNAEFHLLTHKSELELIRKLMEFPIIVARCAAEYEPHGLTQYLSDISTGFHKFYTECRVITEEMDVTLARLGLCVATRNVLANGFKLLGISAPERM